MRSYSDEPFMFGDTMSADVFEESSTTYGSAYYEGHRDGVKAERERVLSGLRERARVLQEMKDRYEEAGYAHVVHALLGAISEIGDLRVDLEARR